MVIGRAPQRAAARLERSLKREFAASAGPEVSSSGDGGSDQPGLVALVPADERRSGRPSDGQSSPSDARLDQRGGRRVRLVPASRQRLFDGGEEQRVGAGEHGGRRQRGVRRERHLHRRQRRGVFDAVRPDL